MSKLGAPRQAEVKQAGTGVRSPTGTPAGGAAASPGSRRQLWTFLNLPSLLCFPDFTIHFLHLGLPLAFSHWDDKSVPGF